MEDKIFAGTGHRPEELGGHGTEPMVKLVSFAVDVLTELKPTKLISGMALGWDQAVAFAAVEKGIPWIAAIPFVGQESIWPKESQTLYQNLLTKASKVVIVCEGGYLSWKMQKRNVWMVDHATDMLALWNGKEEGGTYNCLVYASKKNKPVHNVWSKWVDYK